MSFLWICCSMLLLTLGIFFFTEKKPALCHVFYSNPLFFLFLVPLLSDTIILAIFSSILLDFYAFPPVTLQKLGFSLGSQCYEWFCFSMSWHQIFSALISQDLRYLYSHPYYSALSLLTIVKYLLPTKTFVVQYKTLIYPCYFFYKFCVFIHVLNLNPVLHIVNNFQLNYHKVWVKTY